VCSISLQSAERAVPFPVLRSRSHATRAARNPRKASYQRLPLSVLQEFQRRHERWHFPLTLRMWSNLFALARCRQFHVTRKSQRWYEVRGEGQVKGIAGRVTRHELVREVALHDLSDGRQDRQQRKTLQEFKARLPSLVLAPRQLVVDGLAGDNLVFPRGVRPPEAGPLAPCDHLGSRPVLVIEARNGRLDVDTSSHVQSPGAARSDPATVASPRPLARAGRGGRRAGRARLPVPFLSAASIQGRVALGPDAGSRVERLGDAVGSSSSPSARRALRGARRLLVARERARRAGRARLEPLCRHVCRPALSSERLSLDERGRVLLELRHPWRDGTTHLVFEPLVFLERLAALVPHPREHLLTYHGVLAPASSWRDLVVPPADDQSEPFQAAACAALDAPPPESAALADLRTSSPSHANMWGRTPVLDGGILERVGLAPVPPAAPSRPAAADEAQLQAPLRALEVMAAARNEEQR